MISNRPYMIRALYDWIVDNRWTPHIQVDADYPGVQVPQEYVQDGVIVLNVSPSAVFGLAMENDRFQFKARFGGVERVIGFPPQAVLAIFARENGHGMPFPPEPYPNQESAQAQVASKPKISGVESTGPKPDKPAKKDDKPDKGDKKKKRPTLSVVK
ncbi:MULTISPECIES: ClpXP protease specificity-enhancing factor [Thiomicrorhabdus]|uniref:ClpXP protease specificity-enhancing factor n=1 Tax=Thiomicrorhabdus heinhorstiae TaxID=2748010 RepID=A0ABS0BYE5_9GAMM|nr:MULTISPECIES: ClpXP protease specificity-enhancing factor [Thiomicrorhabdus]MBF6058419.1 ClpXP protease specificity-enhancing factor [Thiomicrorhabdus heinhorstiae]